jgi:hypothetical protein
MKLIDQLQIVSGFVPVNMATGANDGDYVSLKGYSKLGILFFKGAGGAGEPPTLTVTQASAVAGTGAKALNFTEVWVKNNADLTTVGPFTKVTQSAANTYATATGDTQAIVYVEFDAADLDVSGGFDCVKGSVADVGTTAQNGALIYLLGGAAYPQATQASAIVD